MTDDNKQSIERLKSWRNEMDKREWKDPEKVVLLTEILDLIESLEDKDRTLERELAEAIEQRDSVAARRKLDNFYWDEAVAEAKRQAAVLEALEKEAGRDKIEVDGQVFDLRLDFFVCPRHGIFVPMRFDDEWDTEQGCPILMHTRSEEFCEKEVRPVYLDGFVKAALQHAQEQVGEEQ